MKNVFSLVGCAWLLFVVCFTGCSMKQETPVPSNCFLLRAEQTLDSLYRYYGVNGTCLLRENYPSEADFSVADLNPEVLRHLPHLYSYLWPYSGTFSAISALLENSQDSCYVDLLEQRVLPGLKEYFDKTRIPEGYASYLPTKPLPDRYYDDNIWLGINFIDVYLFTGKQEYLQHALQLWHFIKSGIDDKLGGGIYWCEQRRDTKNSCSNAPGSVLALKLFLVTKDTAYLEWGKALYHWTQTHLQDSTDYLYFDNVALDGEIFKAKYAYNSGQMMQSAALLYQITGNENYLIDAKRIAESCYQYFFSSFKSGDGSSFRLLKEGDIWFAAVMLRGYIALYQSDGNDTYLKCFRQNLDYAWHHAREGNGLFNADFSGRKKDKHKWLLTQAAMVEMYARLAVFIH